MEDIDHEQQIAVLEEKIANGEVVDIEMGIAQDWEMNDIPWVAQVIPLGFVKSPEGLRLKCRVDTDNRYMCFDASQTQGPRKLLIGSFKIIS